jgi:ATP-dependent Lon protease
MTKPNGGAAMPSSPVSALPLRTGVLFPGATLTFAVGRARSVALVRSLSPGDVIVTFTQKDPRAVDLEPSDLHAFGTFARVKALSPRSDREYELSLEGLERGTFSGFASSEPFYTATVEPISESGNGSLEAVELARALTKELMQLAREGRAALEPITRGAELDPGAFADRVAAALELPVEHEIELLGATDVVERLRLLIKRVGEGKAKAEVRAKIEGEVKKELGRHQREAVLREQMRAIRRELGDGGEDSDLDLLRERLDAARLTQEARKVADRELRRLESMGGHGAEVHVIRAYLELLADLPWEDRAGTEISLEAISAQLDADHDGLGEIKTRILEHVAVMKLSGNARGTLLCFAGPPGVGKTSLGQSIADAMGRPFVRVALGGVRDESEIRGHRRTYVGALPGRLVNALRKAKVKNPVILLDEIDKLGSGWGGSPEAALLEVLDPEQNRTFSDHYLELPFDLSEVMFLCTANTLDTLSAPLRDRLEIVELSGYTSEEKVGIARRHLMPKRMKEHGLADHALDVTADALHAIVRDYTREAGVRQLDRELRKLCRHAALEVAKDTGSRGLLVNEQSLRSLLGKPKFHGEIAERTSIAGVATGLAWTPVGGSILFIETSRMPGTGRVEITGQLGDVMKESARAALTYVKSNAERLGVESARIQSEDVHIHVPAGAVPKDGPSAGVTIFTALVSLFSGRPVRSDTAMTGEATLRGRVLAVGGIKAKVLAAHRAGVRRIILPAKCAPELEEVPLEVRSELEFILVEDMKDVLTAALEDGPSPELLAHSVLAQGPNAWSNAK